ncbi:unnamed protein product [Brachionus calyciflorus]|uniref:Chitin-binding type-2 domain-containing protein n=1 Tax=Brachionus calyciflorus TaxID=104777 RepID=A0A814C7W2_9BILA|nr:unnamed protein product [Brachionus calyciflorus]
MLKLSCLLFFSYFAILSCKSIEKRQVCIDLSQVDGDCSKFYRCANDRTFIESCPAGTLFDQNLRVCNWASQVTTCETGSNTSSDTSLNNNDISTGSSCNQAQDLTQVPNDCGKFYRCGSGILYTEQCPSGLLFDANLKICNWADEVTTCK